MSKCGECILGSFKKGDFYCEENLGEEQCIWRLQIALNELSDRPTWTPCSEGMPKEEEWIGTKKFGTTISDKILVTFESQGKRFVKPTHFQNGELGGLDKQTMNTFYNEWKAVAWMPLPEPWEGEDDGAR